MPSTQVAVHGILGKMGQEVLRMLCREADMVPVGGADGQAENGPVALPDGSGSIPVSSSLDSVLGSADVVVDFSSAEGAISVIRTASARKVNVVVGSTGIPQAAVDEADSLAQEHQVGIVIAPNFAMGAVLLTHLTRIAAPFFDYADLTEMHHEAKIDAPSGTAIAIAKAAGEGKGGPFTAPGSAEAAGAGHTGWRVRRRHHPQRPHARSYGPSRAGVRRPWPDAHPPPRLDQP